MKFTYKTVLVSLCAVLMLTACGNTSDNGNDTETEITEIEEEIDENEDVEVGYDFEVQTSSDYDVTLLDHDNVYNVGDGNEDGILYVIASNEDEGIWIYGYEDISNIVIEHDGIADMFYNQSWLTPREILPNMNVSDYDGDGIKELAVSYYIGSGTGVSVEELVIYKLNADGHYEATKFNDEYLYSQIECKTDAENNTVTFEDKQTGNGFIAKGLTDDAASQNAYFGNIIGYEFGEDNRIIAKFTPGVKLTYEGFPEISADIAFDGITFSVSNISFAEAE